MTTRRKLRPPRTRDPPYTMMLVKTFIRVGVIGGALGVLSSLMVNCSLVEVSCSPFFAVAFGLLFLTSAAMMFGQLATQPNAKNRTLIIFFALLNGIAGIVCFMLERDWSHGLTASGKVPLYALLGSCLAFSVNFSSLDLIARCECFTASQLLVRAEWQMRVVAITSIFTGGMYGVAFGILDIEDALVKSPDAFRSALNKEAKICYPVGLASGAIAAVTARLLEMGAEARDPELAYMRGHAGLRHDTL